MTWALAGRICVWMIIVLCFYIPFVIWLARKIAGMGAEYPELEEDEKVLPLRRRSSQDRPAA